MGDIALRGQGRALLKKGGRAKDMSKKHEGMESMAEEAIETKLEKKSFRETKSGKMKPKKGILIIVGTKDKESKKMKKGGMIKKGMHKMPNGKIMKNSDMKKGMKK